MDRHSRSRPNDLSPRSQASKQITPIDTTNCNPPDLDKCPSSSPHQRDIAGPSGDAVSVGASIFGPFNALTASNLEILRRQQISKGIQKELAKIHHLRGYLRSLQVADPGFTGDHVGDGILDEQQICKQRHMVTETPAQSVAQGKSPVGKLPNPGPLTPQSLGKQGEQDPFLPTLAPQKKNPTTPHAMPESSKPSPTTSGPAFINSATTPVLVASGKKEKAAVLSWLGTIPENNMTSESQAPKSTCSEAPSGIHTTASIAYSRCRNRLNLQIENLRDWVKKGRAARKEERAVQRGKRSIRNSSRVNHHGFLLGASTATASATITQTRDDAQVTKLLANLETKCMARITAVEQACEFKVGELNAAFGARLADLEDQREVVAYHLANAEKNLGILAAEIEDLTDSAAISGISQNQQLKSESRENATSAYQRRGMCPGQGEAFRI